VSVSLDNFRNWKEEHVRDHLSQTSGILQAD
jgi:hypothetical protein